MNKRERKTLISLLATMDARGCSPNHYAHVRRTLRNILGMRQRNCPLCGYALDKNGWCHYHRHPHHKEGTPRLR